MRKLYLDLDSLLDTRLGTLSQLNPLAASRAVQTGAYWDREYDQWERLTGGLVDTPAFAAAWATRGRPELEAATVTGIIVVIMQILAMYQRNQVEGLVKEDLALEINLHPYNFELEEMDELTSILKHHLYYEDLTVTYCAHPLEQLTPKLLTSAYDTAIMYDFIPWIKHHATALAETRAPDFSLIVPRLFEQDPHSLSVERKQQEITGFQLWLVEHLDLHFINVANFSMFRPDVPNTEEFKALLRKNDTDVPAETE